MVQAGQNRGVNYVNKAKFDYRTFKLGINICANDKIYRKIQIHRILDADNRIIPIICVQNEMNLNLKIAAQCHNPHKNENTTTPLEALSGA